MTVNRQILQIIEQNLSVQITGIKAVGGGSINSTYCLQTKSEKYFIKVNSKRRFPGMFEAEASGLQLMAQTGAVNVPDVVLNGDAGDESFLALEWIETRRPTPNASVELGRTLAMMHKCTAGYFGLDHHNYMGSLPQSNKKHQSWAEFFIAERLQPMVKMASDKRLLTANDMAGFDILYKKLSGLFPEEAPALVHGDLWGGNYLISTDEKPYLIDPAASFGHREADIAMTTLFGGFSEEFYEAYHDAFPLVNGWQQRVDLWNLYPLLVHLNLFGAGYLGQVRDYLRGYL